MRKNPTTTIIMIGSSKYDLIEKAARYDDISHYYVSRDSVSSELLNKDHR